MKFSRCTLLIAVSLFLAPAFCLGQDAEYADLDVDSDGKVTKKEFDDYCRPKLMAFEGVDEFIDRVDADNDGIISEDEFDGRALVLRTLNDELLDGEVKEKVKTTEELKMVDDATKAYDKLTKSVSEGDWKAVATGMTKQANDDYVVGMVAQSIALSKTEIPKRLDVAGVKEAKEATTAVVEKFELDDIDISSMLRNRSGAGPENNDDDEEKMSSQEKAKAQQDKIKADIMAAIDKNDRRWEIVAELNEAQKGTPLSRNIFGGKVGDSDVNGEAVFLTVTRNTTGSQIAVPAVVKMTVDNGSWKYAGLDPSRTQKAIQRMMQRLRGGKDVGPKTDF